MNLGDTAYYKHCLSYWRYFRRVYKFGRSGRSRFYRFRLSGFVMQYGAVYATGLFKVFTGRYGQLAGPVSTSQWFLRDFRTFRYRIDAFVNRRFRIVYKVVFYKGIDLFLRIVWIAPGLRIGCRGYRNDVSRIAVVIAVDFNDRIWLKKL